MRSSESIMKKKIALLLVLALFSLFLACDIKRDPRIFSPDCPEQSGFSREQEKEAEEKESPEKAEAPIEEETALEEREAVLPTEELGEQQFQYFSPYGGTARIPDYLGDELHQDFCILVDALYAGEESANLQFCRSQADFEKIENCVKLLFLPKDLLRDKDFLTVTPFDFAEDGGEVRIYYCWQDESLTAEELPCRSKEDYLREIENFRTTVEEILQDCGAGEAAPEELAKALFDWESSTLYYGIDRNDSPFTALQNHRAYCSIYAGLYQFLCEEAGIPCLTCSGVTGAVGVRWGDHEWNIICLNGDFYHVDCTYQGADHYADGYFFGMSDTICSRLDHGEISDFSGTDLLGQALPPCEDCRLDARYRPQLLEEE